MPNPKIVNAVGGGDLSRELDLQFLHNALEGDEVRYDPEYWPGLYIRFNEDSPAVLVFRTGKYNIAGAESIKELLESNQEFLSRVGEFGISIDDPHFEIRNLVFINQYDRELNLEQLSVALGLENSEYEPEQFPGLLYRPLETEGTFLIFRNGKILLTGAKSSGNADEAFIELFDRLDELFATG